MKNPDWYPDWRHEAFHQLQTKNNLLKAEFNLDKWPRYHYDLTRGTLVFSDANTVKVMAEIQIAGTTMFSEGDWLWAWANAHLPSEIIRDSPLSKAFGEEHGIHELTHERFREDDISTLGWELTSLTVRLSDALGAYRPRDETGELFLIYKNMRWAS